MDNPLGLLFTYIPSWLLLLVAVLLLLYIWGTWKYDLFVSRGIKGPPTRIPFLGNVIPLMKNEIADYDLQLRKDYGDVVGIFSVRTPLLYVFDYEMIKRIMVKEWATFTDRSNMAPELSYPLESMLTSLKGDHWKHVRNILTPTFSTGKLKQMSDLITVNGDNLVVQLKKITSEDGAFEAKELCGRYTMDTIASTAFGMQINSLNEKENDLVENANRIMKGNLYNPCLWLALIFPVLGKLFKRLDVSLMPRAAVNYFTAIIKGAFEARKNANLNRRDFTQLMIEAKVEDVEEDEKLEISDENQFTHKKGLTENEIVCQAVLFFLAGFDTTASSLSFILYNLAINPDCQDRLINEIDDIIGEDEPTSENISKLTYLDMCINETQRLYPPAPRLSRCGNKDITIDGLHITTDIIVMIPVKALHYDPEVYPDPKRFDPERFTAEAKAKRNPFSFMPFGMGPRNCIGMRLALMELKFAVVKIYQKFKFTSCEKTQIPLELDFRQQAKSGLWIKAVER